MMKRYVLLLCCACLLGPVTAALAAALAIPAASAIAAQPASAEPLELLGRSSADLNALKLSDNEVRWLREKRQLVLGTQKPDRPPFSMSNGRHEFEGITADTLALLADMLNLNVKVLRYPDRASAQQALESGAIDLLADASPELADNRRLRQSEAFAQGKPVLIKRSDDNRNLPLSTAPMSLAVESGYLSPAEIARVYPNASVFVYPTLDAAAAAVAFGKNDVLLVDVLVAHYLINLNYKKYLKIADISKLDTNNYRFTLQQSDTRLLELLNKSLAAITSEQRINILKRWSGGGSINESKLDLTPEESRWLQKHPVVRIEVADDFAPISFFDNEDQFRGLTADILDTIQMRTGLHFEIVRNHSFQSAINKVLRGESEIWAPALSSVEREEQFLLSRPFMLGQFVLITKSGKKSRLDLTPSTKLKLALTTGHALLPYLRKRYPAAQILQANNNLAALDLVATGNADAAVTTNFVAEYYFATVFGEKLSTAGIIDGFDGISPQVGFAIQRGDKELHSIINKVILNISPDELALQVNRWRTNAMLENPTWRDYRYRMYPIIIAMALILALSLITNAIMLRQIRRRRSAKYALASQLGFMEALFNGTPHPIYVRDNNGIMLLCNDSYLATIGIEREDVIDRPLPTHLLEDSGLAETLEADYARAMQEDVAVICDRHHYYQGKWHTVYHWIQPFKDVNNHTKGVVCGWIDISDRRQLFEDIKMAKKMADEANHAKSSFLATMSHEIRTPMNAIIGMLELALKRADQGQLDRSSIEVAFTSANHLLGILGDILDLVRIESGHLSLSPERANPRELSESVIHMYEGMARERGLELKLQLDAQVNTDVLVDPLRFKQILSNLVSNAIKFTDQGRIEVQVRASARDEEQLKLHIAVIDSGIGIAEEDRKKLFQLFTQVHGRKRTSQEGTGLGLTICKALCEMMGGSIEIHSSPNNGTRVDVMLSLRPLRVLDTVAQSPAAAIPEQTRPLRILVIDDHEPNRLLIRQQLLYLGHAVMEANDGARGLAIWQEQALDVVISDCQMPGMDGYQLTRTIRSQEQAQQRRACFILGFTANAQPAEHERCIAAGMDDCLFKPVTLNTLRERLARIVLAPEQVQKAEPEAPALPAQVQVQVQVQSAHYDMAELQAATANDNTIIAQILLKLVESNRSDVEEIVRKADAGDFSELPALAHRLQGGARLVNARALIDCCELLQNNAGAGNDNHEELTRQVQQLKETALLLEQALLQEYARTAIP